MSVQQRTDRATQGAGAVAVNDSYFAQTRQRGFVEKLVYCIDSFVSRLSDDVQF